MTDHRASRTFVDLTGRSWVITELTAAEARRIFPGELFFEDPPTVSLMFNSAEHRRYVAHAPAHWYDLSFTGLSSLLRQSIWRGSSRDAGQPVDD